MNQCVRESNCISNNFRRLLQTSLIDKIKRLIHLQYEIAHSDAKQLIENWNIIRQGKIIFRSFYNLHKRPGVFEINVSRSNLKIWLKTNLTGYSKYFSHSIIGQTVRANAELHENRVYSFTPSFHNSIIQRKVHQWIILGSFGCCPNQWVRAHIMFDSDLLLLTTLRTFTAHKGKQCKVYNV